ncbi:hypothetical protein F6W96_30840 [Nocardia terpenica]|uniref:Uncharacterized protein n=1 Tax=Nocardia terpenica TaxID=455432 RepID=A0A6G9Z9D1_9NOCA|nr:hypothetical protein F6W96_30840 [Nocardia terpenica]
MGAVVGLGFSLVGGVSCAVLVVSVGGELALFVVDAVAEFCGEFGSAVGVFGALGIGRKIAASGLE